MLERQGRGLPWGAVWQPAKSEKSQTGSSCMIKSPLFTGPLLSQRVFCIFSPRCMPQLCQPHGEYQAWSAQILCRELCLCVCAFTAQSLLPEVWRSRHPASCVTPWPPCCHLSHQRVALRDCSKSRVMQK